MIITLILIPIFLFGLHLCKIDNHKNDTALAGSILTALGGTYLIIHLMAWGASSFIYNDFVVQRNAFIETIEVSRDNNNQYEVAAISSNIAAYNSRLAMFKYHNQLFLLDDYVDDRMDDLEPIK